MWFNVLFFACLSIRVFCINETDCYECWRGSTANKQKLLNFFFDSEHINDPTVQRALQNPNNNCGQGKQLEEAYRQTCSSGCQLVYVFGDSDHTAISTCRNSSYQYWMIANKYYLKTCDDYLCNNKAWKETNDDPEGSDINSGSVLGRQNCLFLLLLITFIE
ncbi:hypothetical protein M3Y97_00012700 [Aphelenchoides bicaudatus]|nr:hypothetical protein M3Y97_00012700 [Aphelenchoides bicaudatus]